MGSSALLPMHRSMPKRDHKWPSTVFYCSKYPRKKIPVLLAVILFSVLQSAVDGTLYLVPRAGGTIVVEKIVAVYSVFRAVVLCQ